MVKKDEYIKSPFLWKGFRIGMKLIKHITLILIILATSIATAQVKFEIKVSKKKLGINERLRVDFEMNKDGDNFSPPAFSNFTVVGGPSQSVNNSWINGQRSFTKTYSYSLSPKKRGNFTISQAEIEIDGQAYKTSPVTITVTAAIDNPNDPNYIASENLHLIAEISNSNPYLNEAITVVYKLYISRVINVSNGYVLDNPKFVNFWSQNTDSKELKLKKGTYNGKDYDYVVWRKTVLYPQKTGKLNIEPLSLDITVDVPTNRRDIFGGRLMTQVHKTVSAGNRTINVKPLPEAGKPADFTGAVGDFKFKVTTSKSELNATESLQAKVEVSGKGNLKLFELPTLTVPSSLEVYEPEKADNIRTNLNGMQGQRSETYTIVPQYKGKYPIPSMVFSYFDVKAKTYKRLTSDEIIIDVLDGPTNNTITDTRANSTGTNKQPVIASNNQFEYLKTRTILSAIKPTYFFKSKLFWSSLLVPLLAIPLAIVFRRKKAIRDADFVGNRVRKADKLARKYLTDAKKSLGQKEAFYEALGKALHNYLKAKLQIETSDFSKEKISALLTERKVSDESISEFVNLLKNCELARYTPITQVEMQQDYNKASKTISLIDKQIR